MQVCATLSKNGEQIGRYEHWTDIPKLGAIPDEDRVLKILEFQGQCDEELGGLLGKLTKK